MKRGLLIFILIFGMMVVASGCEMTGDVIVGTTYTLTVGAEDGGRVRVIFNDEDETVSDQRSFEFMENKAVTIKAESDHNYEFRHWENERGLMLEEPTEELNANISNDQTFIAVFE